MSSEIRQGTLKPLGKSCQLRLRLKRGYPQVAAYSAEFLLSYQLVRAWALRKDFTNTKIYRYTAEEIHIDV